MLFIKKILVLIVPRMFALIIVLLLIISCNIFPQTSTKRGGIAFRTDDNQPISQYLEYAALFNNYNKKFTFAINLGKDQITSDYLNGIRQMQASGHEMMDHTPWHDTHWFATTSPDSYINHPGVHRINGGNIDLKHANVDINYARRTGYVNTNGNRVTSPSGIFSSFSKSDCYLYFPSIDKLVFIDDKTGWIDQYTVEVTDFWGGSINLGSRSNIQFYNFDYNNVHLTIDALKALAEESLRLANYYNLERPYTWIQPGGYFPHVHSYELKQACGDALGYKSAGVFADPSLKVFNAYNPNNDKQFGMNFGDFKDNIWTLEACKGLIADRIAKHHVVFGENHFDYGQVLLGGWSGFLARTEGLIQWCIANNIPIRTYSEWADVLYNQTPDPNENIFPPLNVDLDANNIPDGYNQGEKGILDNMDGYPTHGDYSYKISKVGKICSISNLGGIEKGANNFEIWTKGASGNFIEVSFKVGSQNLTYKFPAQNAEWTKFNLAQSINGNISLNIPTDISVVDVTISCSNYSSGEVKISGMKLNKSLGISEYLNVTPSNQSVTSNSGSTSFSVLSNISWSLSDDATWLSVSPSSGSNDGILTAAYLENTITAQRVGTITVNGEGITRTVTVTQAAAAFYMTVSPSDRPVSNTAGSTSFLVTSNGSWAAEDDADWITVSPISGSNDGTLTAEYAENTNTYQRVGTITVSGGGITRTVTVTQESAPSLTVTPSDRYVSYSTDSTTFMVSSNGSWAVEDDADWITVTPISGSNDGTLTVGYTENTNTYQRVGTITVTGEGITRTVTVTQESAPSLTVTPSDQYVRYTEGNTTFTITSNRSWTVEDDADWMTVTPSSGSNEGTLTVGYLENSSQAQRIGTIKVTCKGITHTVTVTQAAKKYLTISPINIELSADSGVFNLIIDSNLNWQLDEDMEWINLSKYNGSYSDTIKVKYDSNNKITTRQGKISIFGGKILDEVVVTQNAADVYAIIIPDSQAVSADSGRTTFNIKSNATWIIQGDFSWLTVIPDSGTGDASITVLYNANHDSLSRIGVLSLIVDTLSNSFVLRQEGLELFEITALADSLDAGTTSGSGRYLIGAQAKVIALPNKGWLFKNWKENNTVVSKDSIYNFVVSSHRILVAQFERILTGANDEIKLSDNFELFQNYPNPFNPETHIKFALPEAGLVTLSVYNIFGEKVRDLIAKFLEPGIYIIPFNAKDLASGIYIYRMQAKSFFELKKMSLIK